MLFRSGNHSAFGEAGESRPQLEFSDFISSSPPMLCLHEFLELHPHILSGLAGGLPPGAFRESFKGSAAEKDDEKAADAKKRRLAQQKKDEALLPSAMAFRKAESPIVLCGGSGICLAWLRWRGAGCAEKGGKTCRVILDISKGFFTLVSVLLPFSLPRQSLPEWQATSPTREKLNTGSILWRRRRKIKKKT